MEMIKCFSKYIPINIIPHILNETDIDIVIEDIVNNKDFEKSVIEIETFDNIEELRYPQEYENNSINILDDLNEKEINNVIMIKYKRCLNEDVVIIYLFL